MGKREENNVWLVAYVQRDQIERVDKDLNQYGYQDVEAYIPTIKIIKKKFKGHNVFEFTPLLFNYGFFSVPYEKACDPDFLIKLKNKISCIYGWVRDTTKLNEIVPRDEEGEIIYIPSPGAAVATHKEIKTMKKTSKDMSIFTAEDLQRINTGDFILLRGYPFENMYAEILRIDFKKGEIKVKLDMVNISREVTVSFENVFYTIYKDYEEEGKEKSTEEIDSKAGYGLTDNLLFNEILNEGDYE